MSEMTSSRPYLMRGVYDWIVDNNLTPYLLVNAELAGVYVPQEHVSNGKIVLNIAPEAVQNMDMMGEEVSFNARFHGKPMRVHVPLEAALALYARENGRGMVFSEDANTATPIGEAQPDAETGALSKNKPKGPQLRIVK
jgi:stringent starvation protein B